MGRAGCKDPPATACLGAAGCRDSGMLCSTRFGGMMPWMRSRQAQGAPKHPCPPFPALVIPPGIGCVQSGHGQAVLMRTPPGQG